MSCGTLRPLYPPSDSVSSVDYIRTSFRIVMSHETLEGDFPKIFKMTKT